MKSPASKMQAIKSEIAALEAKKDPAGQSKLDKLLQVYEKENGLIEPIAQ